MSVVMTGVQTQECPHNNGHSVHGGVRTCPCLYSCAV